MKVIDILGELKFEESMDLFNSFMQLDEEYEEIIDANSRVIHEEDMIELEDLRINIMSNGGSIWMCNAICDKIDEIKAKGVKVYTYGLGLVASAGLRIFLKGDYRMAGKSTHFLLHNTQVGFDVDDLVKISHKKSYENEVKEDVGVILPSVLTSEIKLDCSQEFHSRIIEIDLRDIIEIEKL